MRITNSMITGGMMLNINRNMTNVNKYYNQLSTGKKIQVPSDNPILASRALKFRTNVSETEQYQRNVAQGTSWMEVTEGAFNNVNNIMFSIRELAARGASDTLTYEDRQKIMTDIASLTEQIGLEMNGTYAGRYVFSGYRTDQPPVLTEDDKNLIYKDITQYFNEGDVEHTKAYFQDLTQLNGSGTLSNSETRGVTVIKLAYKDLQGMKLQYKNASGVLEDSLIPINCVSLKPPSTPTPPPPPTNPYVVGNYIMETGELILSNDLPNSHPDYKAPIKVPDAIVYDKSGFKKGELNPQIYFKCTDDTVGSVTHGKIFNPDMADSRQHLEYEFSINTRVRVNSNAPDVFTDKMYGDLQALVGTTNYANTRTKEQIKDELVGLGLTGEALEDALAVEMQHIQKTLQDRFANVLGLCDKHISTIATEHTDLGSRMSRLELINNRLEDDKVSYSKLMSDNEDVDYAEAIMKLNSLESIYQASLKTGGNVMKLTLADYI